VHASLSHEPILTAKFPEKLGGNVEYSPTHRHARSPITILAVISGAAILVIALMSSRIDRSYLG
jgi:hypothetical protein